MMKLNLYITLVSFIFLTNTVLAYEGNTKLPDQFQYGLSGLKESMVRLQEGNASFELQIKTLREEQARLNNFLKDLELQEEVLQEKSESFEETAEEKKKLLVNLQIQIDNIQQHIEQLNTEINSKQQRETELQLEESQPVVLESQNKETSSENVSVESASYNQLRQQKLKLMKEILESQKRQQMLQQDLVQFKKTIKKPVDELTPLKEKNQNLKLQVERLQVQLKELDIPETPQELPIETIDNEQAQKLVVLKAEIEDLNKRQDELGAQIKSMPIQEKKIPDNEMAFNDQKRLQVHLDQLKKDNNLLQQQVRQLKSEMIALDKKKTKIEAKFKR